MIDVAKWTQRQIDAALAVAGNDSERASLLAHATTDGPCDAEYCPWAHMTENMCIRNATHHRNCRCPDCCALDDECDY